MDSARRQRRALFRCGESSESVALRLPEFGYEVGFACLKRGKFQKGRQCKSTQLFDAPMRFKFDLFPAKYRADVVKLGD